jgi:hypothetical protein
VRGGGGRGKGEGGRGGGRVRVRGSSARVRASRPWLAGRNCTRRAAAGVGRTCTCTSAAQRMTPLRAAAWACSAPLTTPMMVKGSISRWVVAGLQWLSYSASCAVFSSFTSRYSSRPCGRRGGSRVRRQRGSALQQQPPPPPVSAPRSPRQAAHLLEEVREGHPARLELVDVVLRNPRHAPARLGWWGRGRGSAAAGDGGRGPSGRRRHVCTGRPLCSGTALAGQTPKGERGGAGQQAGVEGPALQQAPVRQAGRRRTCRR